jgi:threonylcarbamoyladenosine tRNA methylthiotransferase MtaB
MRVRVDSIGCRLNISEMEEMARQFAGAGHRLVGPGEPADLCVFNTCAVTHTAARKSRQAIRQLRRANPGAVVVVTGCYAHLSPDEVRTLGADLVVSNEQKEGLPELLAETGLLHHNVAADDHNVAADADPIPAIDAPSFMDMGGDSHTRAFVKAQDGCDNRCSFCIVTIARGESRSRPTPDLIAEINRLAGLGYQEAVLSGVHLGAYGHDGGDRRGLLHLVAAVLAETSIPRLRLSSLEPWDLPADFFELWRNERLLPHLHLPLQSGCDATLRRMARRTTQADFARLVEAARAAIPDVAITTDIIVGFPGETEAEFAESLAFVERMAFAKLHIFRYSRREGTAAAVLKGAVPPPAAQERSRRMHALGAALEQAFRQKFVGRTLPVLWECHEPAGDRLLWSGLIPNYVRVFTQTGPEVDLRNQILPTQLVRAEPAGLWGQIEEPPTPLSTTRQGVHK